MAVIATDVLVVFATLVLLLSVTGLFAMRDAVDKLHYVGPATTLAPLALALAIVIEDGFTSQAGLKSLVVAIAIAATSPIVTYATLRAIQTRDLGRPIAPVDPEVQR
jgi:multisubunit Na+/H+ antiporter MnhG subunit